MKRKTTKQSILGRRISRHEALKGLGNPNDWQKEADDLYKEFHTKAHTVRVIDVNRYGLPLRIVSALGRAGIKPSQTRRIEDVVLRKVAGIGGASLRQIRRKVGRISASENDAKKVNGQRTTQKRSKPKRSD